MKGPLFVVDTIDNLMDVVVQYSYFIQALFNANRVEFVAIIEV